MKGEDRGSTKRGDWACGRGTLPQWAGGKDAGLVPGVRGTGPGRQVQAALGRGEQGWEDRATMRFGRCRGAEWGRNFVWKLAFVVETPAGFLEGEGGA